MKSSKNTKRDLKNNSHKKVSIKNGLDEFAGKPKIRRYSTTFSRLSKLILNMSEDEQLQVLKHAKAIVDERILPRNPCMIPADCKLKDKSYKGLILDLNSFGAYIDTSESFPIGEEIHLNFYNPFSHKEMLLDGKVIWSNSSGSGVKFSDWARMRYAW